MVVRGGCPFSKPVPTGRLLFVGVVCFIRKAGRSDLAGALVNDLGIVFLEDDFIKWLGSLDGGAANFALTAGWVSLESYLRKEGGHLVVIVLGPSLEGVVMAFVAIEASGKEKMGRVFHRVLWSTKNLIVRGWRVVLVGAGSGNDFLGEFIVRSVLGDFFTDPFAEQLGSLGREELTIHL